MNAPNIIELIPEDNVNEKNMLLPAFLEIWNAEENLKYLSFTLKPLETETVSHWLENHKKQGVRHFCALNSGNEMLGISIIKVSPIMGFELYGIGVRPDLKKQGIGRELIMHAINVAKGLEYKSVDVLVFADNVAMLRLLLSLGFIPTAMEYHKRADGADTVLLKKYI